MLLNILWQILMIGRIDFYFLCIASPVNMSLQLYKYSIHKFWCAEKRIENCTINNPSSEEWIIWISPEELFVKLKFLSITKAKWNRTYKLIFFSKRQNSLRTCVEKNNRWLQNSSRIPIGIPVRKAADFDYCELMEHDSSDRNSIANCSSLTLITPSILPTTVICNAK